MDDEIIRRRKGTKRPFRISKQLGTPELGGGARQDWGIEEGLEKEKASVRNKNYKTLLRLTMRPVG